MPELMSLDIPTEHYWIDLPRGVRVRVRPLDTAMMKASEARSQRKVRELVEHVVAVRDAGGDVTGLPDFGDPDVAAGLAEALFVEALAEIGIVAWTGVAAPLSPVAAAQLMRNPDIGPPFLVKYLAPVSAASAEGNASAAGSDGTSEPGGDTARDA